MKCSVAGCGKPYLARGYCPMHYRRWRLYGDPLASKLMSREDRFWSKVDKSGDCWIWTASRNQYGYGQFRLSASEHPAKAHRMAWELVHGQIPDGLWVLHHCDNPPCVNPDHLYLGTVVENVRDMYERDRANTAPGVEAMVRAAKLRSEHPTCGNGHLYDEANTYRSPSKPNARVCRKCAVLNQERFRERRRAG